jgi:hypothetical protein
MSARPLSLLSVVVVVLAVFAVWACASQAAVACEGCQPWLHLTSSARPSELEPGGEGQIVASVSNLGDAPTSGVLTIVDVLPAGLKATGVEALAGEALLTRGNRGPVKCSLVTGQEVRCGFEKGSLPTETGTLAPYQLIEVRIDVEVSAGASSAEENHLSVSGAGAASASLARRIEVSEEGTSFGVEQYELASEEAGGAPDTQAGSHPFQLTTMITLNQEAASRNPLGGAYEASPVALAKDTSFKWPPGLIGNPTPFARCTLGQFLTVHASAAGEIEGDECPAQSAVGVAMLTVDEPIHAHVHTFTVPLFNLEPRVGEPARFGFLVDHTVPVYIDPALRTGSDYGITVNTNNITQITGFLSAQVTVWGVPGDPRHDTLRGFSCLEETLGSQPSTPCSNPEQVQPPPFISMPTSCTGPLATSVEVDSWAQPLPAGQRQSFAGPAMPALDGCNQLGFDPSVSVAANGQAASTPTGLTVDVHVPQEVNNNGAGLASSNVKDITVALPEGVVNNPAAADGLQACSEAQIGYLQGESDPPGELHFTEKLPVPLEPGVQFCPNASKIGTVKIKTPLLANSLEGSVYLASPQNFAVFPQENPFEALVAIYIVAEDPVSGSLIKLAGKVSLNPNSGQITTTVEDNPELAFEDAELQFFGGERAPLATPAHCGSYTTTATFTPWSGTAAVSSQSSFQITSGPNGSPCPAAGVGGLPFNPTLASDTTNVNAGSFTPLTTTLSREDGNQNIENVVLSYPPGISSILSGVKLCPEAQANAGTCGAESQIGETIVSVGLGGDPFTVTGGKVYITESYQGAPFGLSIVNPASAGPFDLQEGKPVVVRAKIEVNPITAALTITTSDIPHIIDGFPLQIKHVNVTVNRPNFTFNPTNCSPQAITGTIGSAEGASAPVSVPFQVTNCASLKFSPKFEVRTSGKTSKANGASLTTTLEEPVGALGTQANIAYVKVELPKALPSRLTTLQKACTDAQFEANPAGCPAASDIGHAVVRTPLLPVPLEGPAIFVSHGGEAFPSLTMVLQGYGVTIDLVGATFINKAGITSTTFKTTPDTPFNSFELTLPEGPYSALAANGNLCQQKLEMPTAFVAQNGATLNQTTNIKVEGCSTALSLVSKHLTKSALKLSVAVPSGGKLTAGGVGLSPATKSAKGRETITVMLKVKPTRAQATLLADHHGRKLVDHVKLTFRPANGKKVMKTFSVMV